MAAGHSELTTLVVALLVGFALTPVIATGAAASETDTRVAPHVNYYATASNEARGPISVQARAPQASAPQPSAPQPSAPQASASQFAHAKSAASTTTVPRTAAPKPFPIGYVIGGILVILGVSGGIYGQRMRIRGRRPPRK